MNLLALFSLLGGLLPLVDRVASAPTGNDSECSQKMKVGAEYMWITDVLSNHQCQMGPLFNAAMGRGNAPNMFDKLFSSSPATRSVCAGLNGLLGAAEQKNMMDTMCSSLGKNWDVVFCKSYYPPGELGEVLKTLANDLESSFLPPEVQSVISSLASMDQSSCYGTCGGGKGFICKAFVGLAVALLNPSLSSNGGNAGNAPQIPDTGAGVPANPGDNLPLSPVSDNKSLPSQKVPARFSPSFGDGKLLDKDPKDFGFVDPSNERPGQPGLPVNPALKPGPFPPEGFPGNSRQANGSMLSRFGPKGRRPFPGGNVPAGQGQPQPGFGQPQTGFGQPQAGMGQPQTGFGPAQTGARQPQTGFQQPEAVGDQSVLDVGQAETNAGPPQTSVGQPQTNPGQPQPDPGQAQTNPEQPQTTQNKPPSVEDGTRTGPPKEPPEEDDESDMLAADDEEQNKDGEKQDEDKEESKPVLESPHEDDEEHELFDKESEDDDDDEDFEEDKMEKEKLSHPQFQHIPNPPGGKLPSNPNEGVPPRRPPEMGKPPGRVVDGPNNENRRPPAFNAGLHKAPAPVEIKSVDSAPVEEEEYHGHGPFFFLTILCVAVATFAMCYCCITNKMRVRETIHIMLTSKGSKARREYR